jgi:3-isopropylmalate/(R)-2-methylmalate dehydratase large subunit
MTAARSLFHKIWDRHAVAPSQLGDDTLIYVDRCLVHEESNLAFEGLRLQRSPLRRPESVTAFVDHYAPTLNRDAGIAAIPDPEVRDMLQQITANAKEQKLRLFGIDHAQQGIMHVVAPEMGLILPGIIVVGSDSHTCTSGAFGAVAFGVGQSELKQVFATQTIWRRAPLTMRVRVDGALPAGTFAKDLILSIISTIGANGANAYAVEFVGTGVASLSMAERMTVCNMSVEMGAHSAIIAPDDTTFEYLTHCQLAPHGKLFERAVEHWRDLRTDDRVVFDREVDITARNVAPMVTWGTSLDDVMPVSGCVPNPMHVDNVERRARMIKALAYMDLDPGVALTDIPIDIVFIGSCTNSRIEDLRAAAAILKDRRAIVPAIVSPGSRSVKRQAEAEGLDQIFLNAGFEWRDSGCSMCVGSNGDIVKAGQRCASSSPRNFEGRQGVGARTHVMNPQMAALAAIMGHIADVRTSSLN